MLRSLADVLRGFTDVLRELTDVPSASADPDPRFPALFAAIHLPQPSPPLPAKLRAWRSPRSPRPRSLSLGAPRRFVLRHATVKDRSMAFLLGDGALLVMAGATQHHYRHSVPKTAEAGERINLTFRQVITPGR